MERQKKLKVNKPNKEKIEVVYLKNVGMLKTKSSMYVVNTINNQEQLLINHLKNLKEAGLSISEIVEKTNLSKRDIRYYLSKNCYDVEEDQENLDIAYMPLIWDIESKNFLNNICYDYNELEDIFKELFKDYKVEYVRKDNGFYESSFKNYKVKRKTTD